MAEYGFLISQGTGKTINITSGARAASFLGVKDNGQYPNWQDWNNCYFTDYVAGTSMYVIPIITANFNPVPGGAYPALTYATYFDISGSKVTPRFNSDTPNNMRIAAMQIYPAGNPGAYGLALRDATDFSAITNSGMAGVVTYSARVLISGTWYLPAAIPGREYGVIFANFTNPNVSLAPTPDLTGVIATDFSGNAATVEAYIVYVSSGFNLTIPQYGFAIYNTAGQATFTSAHTPLLLRGEVSMPGSGMQWVGAPAGIQQMMVPVCSPGADFTTGQRNQYLLYRSGITMNGNSFAIAHSQLTGSFTTGSYVGLPRWCITSTTIPVLDATDYF
ncbi:hypothetical protein I2492_04320 [Budviciaceae bacterium CWB-B4]|uniref:Uncharacterized protein n=1 Tax=Limnobaculum xujianqingii TaxID=2738837 RepID=A0A9D7FWI4_9GAMM|nr:DUF6453 family protein [Limnobaculum xujianqingii]MBK5072241.1 hypothetical protein [Limnobaculum xujianqingii]MBK5175550.1 hypothetical protein [Limnobaculum xujianqingii]